MHPNRKSLLALCALFLLASTTHAVLNIPNNQPKVSAAVWNPILDKTWEGLKKRNIDAYTTGLVHRPKSEMPGDAVSEGVGYGMIMALYANDQETFNKIWDASEKYMYSKSGEYYNWRVNKDGSPNGYGPATDADEDIALMLIFADKLVQAGKWDSYTSPVNNVSYATRAQILVNTIWSVMIGQGKYVLPGKWGGTDLLNAGYFSPASYRVFKDFDANAASHNWNAVIDQCYLTLQSNTTLYDVGMIQDWSTAEGEFLSSGPGYNAYLGGNAFFKDAIRILWRISLDALWFNEPRAQAFLGNSLKFINEKGGATAANFYQLEGDSLGKLVPAADRWVEFNDEDNAETWRYRREHSHLTIGMWATAAMAVGTSADKKSFSLEMSKYYEKGAQADFFGKIKDSDPAALEDTLHNEMYFDQFLAWFGVATMTGVFNNVAANLATPVQATIGLVYDPFAPTPVKPVLGQQEGSLRITKGVAYAPEGWEADTRWTLWTTDGKAQELGIGKSVVLPRNQGLGILQARQGSSSLSLRYLDL